MRHAPAAGWRSTRSGSGCLGRLVIRTRTGVLPTVAYASRVREGALFLLGRRHTGERFGAEVRHAVTVIGNPKAASRTRLVAETVLGSILDCVGGGVESEVVELADYASEIFVPESPALNELIQRVGQSDLIVVASPTFKATYTGLLKGFFDRYGNNGLAGSVVVPVMVGASPVHALAPEVFLRPLLV